MRQRVCLAMKISRLGVRRRARQTAWLDEEGEGRRLPARKYLLFREPNVPASAPDDHRARYGLARIHVGFMSDSCQRSYHIHPGFVSESLSHELHLIHQPFLITAEATPQVTRAVSLTDSVSPVPNHIKHTFIPPPASYPQHLTYNPTNTCNNSPIIPHQNQHGAPIHPRAPRPTAAAPRRQERVRAPRSQAPWPSAVPHPRARACIPPTGARRPRRAKRVEPRDVA